MDDYTAAADKLLQEIHHMEILLDTDDISVDLALAQAKRVRRESTVLVRALARHRDSYSPEGTSE
jgi:hypothetical protein